MPRHAFPVALLLVLPLFMVGCAKSSHPHDDEDHGHEHVHTAPHGGTLVVLAEEIFHLELVHDPAAGTLDAYVLDGHAENFVRVAQRNFEVRARQGGTDRILRFEAVANSATGETVGDTSQYQAQAEWLQTTTEFDATLDSITIRGSTFTGVPFNFPAGNHPD